MPANKPIAPLTRHRALDGKHFHGWFRDEVYQANVYLLWPFGRRFLPFRDTAGYFKRSHQFIPNNLDDTPDGRCISIPGRGVVIFLSRWRGTPEDHSTLSHEVFHAVSYILDPRGIPYCPGESNEPFAYLLDSLHRRCLQMIMG
jgi:hypothetical protein